MQPPEVPDRPRRTPLDKGAIREVREMGFFRPAVSYGIAAGIFVAALIATMLFAPILTQAAFLFFWPAILIIAWLTGFRTAVIASAAAVLTVDYYVIEPPGINLGSPTELGALVAFVLLSAATSWAVTVINNERRNAALAAAENARLARTLDDQSVELAGQLEESQAMQEELELSSEELAERTAEAEGAEKFLRGILESISDPFVVHDASWRFRYINSAASFTLVDGVRASKPENLIGEVVWEVWPEIKGTRFETEMRRAAETRTPVTFEAYNATSGNWARLHCYPLPDGGLATQWKDVTARKQAQEASEYLTKATSLLAASLDYEQTLGEVAKLIVPHFADWCSVSVVDEAGILHQVAVAHADPARVEWAAEINRRYPPNMNATIGLPEVIRTGRAELYAEITDDMLVAGAIDEEHLRLMREIGLKSVMIVPLTTSQRTVGAITVVSAESGRRYTDGDLEFATELARRAALAVENARLHHAEREARIAAENANEAKTQFLAVMSHELRTPLNAIGGYAELLMMGIRGEVNADQQSDLERIQRSQRNLLSLINDILNYAKLEAGHVEFDMKPVALHPLLLDLEPLITPQLHARSLIYDYTGCDESLGAFADAEKLRQILLNLLSNAIKFTEPGGTVAVSCLDAGENVSISVRDTGIGIPEERLATVFEPFVQLERRLTSNHEGTGLGLAISRDLARGLGGELSATSTFGKGSEFVVTLPKASTKP